MKEVGGVARLSDVGEAVTGRPNFHLSLAQAQALFP